MTIKHTPFHPLPWIATDDGYITSGNDYVAIFGAEEWAQDEKTGESPPWVLQDAAFIVQAVNNFEKLLEAVKAIEWGIGHYHNDDSLAYRTCPSCAGPDRPDYIGPSGHFTGCQLRAAIAAAEGRTE